MSSRRNASSPSGCRSAITFRRWKAASIQATCHGCTGPSSTRIRCSRVEGECLQRAGPHAVVRGRGIPGRLADRGAAQRRWRQVLLAHHALDHALVFDHTAARRSSIGRACLGADRRRKLLGLEHQLSSQARAHESGSLRDAGRRGHPRQIRARHIYPARQQGEQLSDRPRVAAPRPFVDGRGRNRNAGRFHPGKHGADPGSHQGDIYVRPTAASS